LAVTSWIKVNLSATEWETKKKLGVFREKNYVPQRPTRSPSFLYVKSQTGSPAWIRMMPSAECANGRASRERNACVEQR
jgi:hypothetical protein